MKNWNVAAFKLFIKKNTYHCSSGSGAETVLFLAKKFVRQDQSADKNSVLLWSRADITVCRYFQMRTAHSRGVLEYKYDFLVWLHPAHLWANVLVDHAHGHTSIPHFFFSWGHARDGSAIYLLKFLFFARLKRNSQHQNSMSSRRSHLKRLHLHRNVTFLYALGSDQFRILH